MEVQLYPVTDVYGGNLFYPIERAREIYTRYRGWIAAAPDELTSSIVIMNYPLIPQVPDFLRGQSFVMVRGCYCGPVEEGAVLVQSWRDWLTPIIDDFKTMPFSQVATISNDPLDPVPGVSSGDWLGDLSDGAIEQLLRFGPANNGASPLVVTEIRHAGGAVARADAQTSAYRHRDATLLMQLIGMAPTAEAQRYLRQYIEEFKGALRPYLTGGVYMNFLEGEESQTRVQDGFSPEAYRRLTGLKATYDPENRLGFSFNIMPA